MNLPIIYPMAAKALDDEEKLNTLWEDPAWLAERKWDGARYLMYVTGDGGPNRLFSRRESVKDNLPVEKTDNVPHLRDTFIDVLGLTVFDGEIITPNVETSSEVVKIMGASPEKAVERQKEVGPVQYMVFDILYADGMNVMDLPLSERRAILEEMFELGRVDSPDVHLTESVTENKEQFYRNIVANGGEGVILKRLDAPYVPGKRPANNWVKVKKYQTFDVVVTGFEPAEMEYKGKTSWEEWPYWAAFQDGEWRRVDKGKVRLFSESTVKPVTRFWWNGWVGAVRFGQYVPKTEEELEECQRSVPELDNCECRPECEGYWKLVEIGQTSGFDDETRQAISEHPEHYIGRVFECGAMERIAGSNALRHPRWLRWRDDKQPQDCILGEC